MIICGWKLRKSYLDVRGRPNPIPQPGGAIIWIGLKDDHRFEFTYQYHKDLDGLFPPEGFIDRAEAYLQKAKAAVPQIDPLAGTPDSLVG